MSFSLVLTLHQRIEFVAGQPADLEFFREGLPGRLVLVDHRVEVGVALLRPHGAVDDLAAHEYLVGQLGDFERAVGHDT
jgi:hypothetical protein